MKVLSSSFSININNWSKCNIGHRSLDHKHSLGTIYRLYFGTRCTRQDRSSTCTFRNSYTCSGATSRSCPCRARSARWLGCRFRCPSPFLVSNRMSTSSSSHPPTPRHLTPFHGFKRSLSFVARITILSFAPSFTKFYHKRSAPEPLWSIIDENLRWKLLISVTGQAVPHLTRTWVNFDCSTEHQPWADS